jgi:tetratricopeptide (TPR) repeat protein
MLSGILIRHSKSQLAIETTHRFRRASPETFVFWLHASSTARFEQSVRNTLEQLQGPGIDNPNLSVFQLFRTWLLDRKQRRTWLIVLDNVDDAQLLRQSPSKAGDDQRQDHGQQSEQYLDYLPVCEHGILLATSRNRAAALSIVSPDDIINIGPMDETQGIAMLQRKLGPRISDSVEELSQLATELDSMPLAMAQAASYIRERTPRCSVKRYLDKLTSEQTRQDILGQQTQDLRRDRDAQNCILKTWHITFEHIRRQESSAADLLSLMSFFDRNAIPEALLYEMVLKKTVTPDSDPPTQSRARLAFRDFINRNPILTLQSRKNKDVRRSHMPLDSDTGLKISGRVAVPSDIAANVPNQDLDDDIQILRNYSLVTVIPGSTSFEMHRLVQLATQAWLKANGSFERWGSQFMMNLDDAFPEGGIEDSTSCQPLFPHVYAVIILDLQDRIFVLRQASILAKNARFAFNSGAFADSQKMAERALESRIELLGPKHEDTVHSMIDLGIIYANVGLWDKSQSVTAEALHSARQLWGENHGVTLEAMAQLAAVYGRNGRLVDAETMQIKVYGKLKQKYAEENDKTLAVMIGLADTVSKRGRHREAMDMANRALKIAKQLCPPQHHTVFDVLQGRADVYFEAGDYEEARQSFNEVLLYSSELLGVDHPYTLTVMYRLSSTMHELGRRRSASNLMRACTEKSERILGPQDANTVKRYKQLRDWESEGPKIVGGKKIRTDENHQVR